MAMQRMEVTNYERWGKLVKTWATGVNKFDPNKPAIPRPTTIQDFKAQLLAHQVGATIPDRYTDVLFVQLPSTILFVRLPPKDLIEDTEQLLQTGGAYPLSPIYKPIFGNKDPVIADPLKFHAERIGDYTISNCG